MYQAPTKSNFFGGLTWFLAQKLPVQEGFELRNRLQAAQLLESFTRLQLDNDAALSKRIFDYAQEKLLVIRVPVVDAYGHDWQLSQSLPRKSKNLTCEETLPKWDASALTQLCAALAASRRAARQPLETLEVKGMNAWGRVVHRCVEACHLKHFVTSP